MIGGFIGSGFRLYASTSATTDAAVERGLLMVFPVSSITTEPSDLCSSRIGQEIGHAKVA